VEPSEERVPSIRPAAPVTVPAGSEPGRPARQFARTADAEGAADLPDVVRRLARYRWLIAVFVLVGLVAGLARGSDRMYTATARVVLDTPDPATRQQSVAIADTVKAIATSPTQVSAALDRARIRRDPTEVAQHHVAATGLGSSAIVRLSVSDQDPRAAARIANALALQVILARERVTRGTSEQQLSELDAQIAELGSKMADLDGVLAGLNTDIATATSASPVRDLRAQQEAASRQRDVLAQQRRVLESERVTVLAAFATRPKPSVISSAVAPTQPDSSGRLQYMVLGALLGLILGVATAALMEMIRPTIVGGEALAAELGVALLAETRGLEGSPTSDLSRAAGRIQLAADGAGLAEIELIAWPTDAPSRSFRDELRSTTAGFGLEIESSGVEAWAAAAARSARGREHPVGVVLLAPSVLKRRDAVELGELLVLRRSPVLGLVAYTRRGSVRQTLARALGGAQARARRVMAGAP
jgi:capsular polysaccharide biosynthesis protein